MDLEQIVKETVAKFVAEKKGKDLTGDGKIDSADYLKARSNAIEKAKGLDEDYEVAMAQDSLDSIIRAAMMLKAQMGDKEINLPAWIQDHITNAENYIYQAAKGYHESDAQMDDNAGAEEMDEARFEKGTDIGGKGFEFKDIAKKAAKQYGSKEAGQRVAGAILKKVLNKEGEVEEANLGHNETSSIEQEGRFWIVTYNTADGTKEKSFESEDEARKFYNGLDESNSDKVEKYKKYTYTLDGELVKPEITFLNNILKAMLGNKIYNIGAPENGKVELSPESGKKGMYNEAEDISDDELAQLQKTADDTSKMPAERDAARNKIYASRAKKESQELDEWTVSRWQHYAGIK
jgi:hypothetical protein